MDIQSVQEPNINQPSEPAEPSQPIKKGGIKFGLSIAVVIICFVAAGVAVYWIKTEPVEQPELNVKISRPTNETAGWQTYRNEEYGFEVKYSPFYKEFLVNPSDKTIGKYVSLSAVPQIESGNPGFDYLELEINIFNIDTYTFFDAPGGATYSYDAKNNKWWVDYGFQKKTEVKLEMLTIDKWTGYWLKTGDAGFSFEALAIPNKEKNILIEISFTENVDSKTNISKDQIASTFKFIK